MKNMFALLLVALFFGSCSAQVKSRKTLQPPNDLKNETSSQPQHLRQQVSSENNVMYFRPKLVVGIVVDQMRYDYLTRFYDKYKEGGFKRMISEGYNFKNNHYNYVPTYTGPGHASIYTGTTPKYHGIIGNNWYDKYKQENVYCAGDASMQSLGTDSDDGQMSPRRLKTTTFTDENRIFTQFKGKTIGVSFKDRGAILPAGHTANAAYWFRGKAEGTFISSSYYMDKLPQWVNEFNSSDLAKSYLKEWNTLYDIATYTESTDDKNNYEGGFKGKADATFPYDLKTLSKENGGYDILKSTPYGNSLTTDFAMAAIKGENLGKDNYTDVLALSYSCTDYVGHNFGVSSKEVQDTYLRLDLDLKRLLDFLDSEVGKGEYTVFLTADHAAVEVPSYLMDHHVPAGYFDRKAFQKEVEAFSENRYGENVIEKISNGQLFLDHKKLRSLKLNPEEVQQTLVDEIINYKDIDKAYSANAMGSSSFDTGVESMLQKGYNQKRSGDVLFVLEPATISYSRTGSSHGSYMNYDTHVPFLLYGAGIRHGSSYKRIAITDIAPTMSALLGTSFPNAAIGTVRYEAFK